MSDWSDEDAELLLRAGDSPSTVARLLGMDIERVEGIAAERSRAKLEPEERQRIGEIRRELRGEKPEPKAEPKPPVARPTRSSRRPVPHTAAEMFSAEESERRSAESELMRGMEARIAELEVKLRDTLIGRDEARAEMDRINVLLTKEQDLRWAERKDANEKIEQLKAELAAERRESATNQKAGIDLANQIGAERDEAQREVERLEGALDYAGRELSVAKARLERAAHGRSDEDALRARAESAEAEVRRLAEEVRGLGAVAVAIGRIEDALSKSNTPTSRGNSRRPPGSCRRTGCLEPIKSRGLCAAHYLPKWSEEGKFNG